MKKLFNSLVAFSFLALLAPLPAKAHLLTYEHSHAGETLSVFPIAPETLGSIALVMSLLVTALVLFKYFSKKIN